MERNRCGVDVVLVERSRHGDPREPRKHSRVDWGHTEAKQPEAIPEVL